MEVLGLIFLIFVVWVVFKILGALFYTGAFLITLPLKILGAVLMLVLFLPLGIISFAAIGLLIPLIPIVLIVIGIVALLRHI